MEGDFVNSVDEAIELMGGFGRHQLKILFLQVNIMMLGSYALYPIGFYELQPAYECSHYDL